MLLKLLFLSCVSIVRVASSCCTLVKALDTGSFDYVDLTIPVDNHTYYFKPEGSPTNSSERPQQPVILTRGGTQFESPSGFVEGGKYVTDIPTTSLIVQMITIDVSSKVKDDPNYVLTVEDLLLSTDHDTLEALSSRPTLLIIKFGWGKHYYHGDKYVGYNATTETYSFPVLSHEVAEWITTNKLTHQVVGVGVDLPNVERDGSNGFPVHKTLAHGGIYILENLYLTEHSQSHSCTIGVMPVRKFGTSRQTASLAGICQKDTCEDNIKEIDKREDNGKDHTCHCKHKCMKHHSMHEMHGTHESSGNEHNSHTNSGGNSGTSTNNNSSSGTSNSTNGSNSGSSSGNSGNNTPNSNNNSSNNGSSSGSNGYKEPKGPHKIIDSVFKFNNMFNKDKQQ